MANGVAGFAGVKVGPAGQAVADGAIDGRGPEGLARGIDELGNARHGLAQGFGWRAHRSGPLALLVAHSR